ncbi:MAG: Crp/Fnr family transcriptional regulator [Gammaproteobacteria bacterium]
MAERFPINERTLLGARYFDNLTADQRHEVVQRCMGRRYRPREVIVSQCTRRRDVYFIISGEVRVAHANESGRETTLRALYAGACFGELAALDGECRSADVVAKTETSVLVLSQEHFVDILGEYPGFAAAIMQHLARLVRGLTARVVEFSTLSVDHRIRAEILRMADAVGVVNNQAVVNAPPTHAEIAARVSTHREAVAREISHLQKLGMIRCERRTWRIVDVTSIRHRMGAGPEIAPAV